MHGNLSIIDEEDSVTQETGLKARLFSPMKNGSLRLCVINLMICGTSGSFFWYPIVIKEFGYVLGAVFLVLTCILTYFLCAFIMDAFHDSQIKDYLNMIHYYLGNKGYYWACFTFISDYFSTYIIGIMLGQNIFLFLAYYMGFIGDEAVTNDKLLLFDLYNPVVKKLRIYFCLACLIILTPLFLKKHLSGIKVITIVSFTCIILIVVYQAVDLISFRRHYLDLNQLKTEYFQPPHKDQIKKIPIFITVFYVQSNILTVINHLSNPLKRRTQKVLAYPFFYFILFSLFFGFWGYFCLGDFYSSDLFFLRKSIRQDLFERIYQVILAAFGVVLVIFLCFFNLSFMQLWRQIFSNNINYYLMSLTPLYLAILFVMVYPNIVNFLEYNGIIVCLSNGFLFPILIKMHLVTSKAQKFGLGLLMFALVALNAASMFFLLRDEFK